MAKALVERRRVQRRVHPVLFAAACAAAYLLTIEAVALWPVWIGGAGTITRMTDANLISLLTGTVTAAGLAALYSQLINANDAAQTRALEAAFAQLELNRAAALRADRLHVDFNSSEMRRQRGLAWRYLKFLREAGNGRLLTRFVQCWISDDAASHGDEEYLPMPAIPGGATTSAEYEAAVSFVIAFFVRLNTHVQLLDQDQRSDPSLIADFLAPFFWWQWRGVLEMLAIECINQERRPVDNPGVYYFVKPLAQLIAVATTAVPGWARRAAIAEDLH